jgi:hypothetical protein
MRDLARQGIYRIIYDIIKADSIIVRHEIDAIKLLCDKYGITPKHRMASMNLSLAEAVKEVQSLTIGQVEELHRDISQLIMADDACSREEALLLFAIMKAIDGKCEVVSVPWGEIMMDNSQLLFIEEGYDEAVNEYIEAHYNTIVNTCKVGGFDFVYIPRLTKVFASQSMASDLFFYFSPTATIEEAKRIADNMCNVTTSIVYCELLVGKMGFRMDVANPSLLFRVSFSVVNGQRMANYALINTDSDMLVQLEGIVSELQRLQNDNTLTINNINVRQDAFIYNGFYRTLFDLLTYRKGAKCELVVRPYSHGNVLSVCTTTLESETEQPLELGPKESAFYVFLIKETQEYGGFRIDMQTKEDLAYLSEAQKRFEETYFSLCNRDTAPDITDAGIRRPMLSKIRKAIENNDIIVQRMMFMPEVSRDKSIKVYLDKIVMNSDGRKN